ncbi:modification methylase [candidate division KSB3 bacterium]|uniref:Site-specific DNA-methyltransferase (adenine-specific) n=1 Tax=candidate division KSB3 bacterium TaxID=2044937 RepID=A0A2G6KKH0_9BACT|nr:MAG: modification methylase [candidate division KSB3 bacterium]
MPKTQQTLSAHTKANKAKPFLKWAGGKVQLLTQFEDYYPPGLKAGEIDTYIEPFIGGGAVFLDVVQHYEIKSAFLYDINKELILTYRVIQREPEQLIKQLEDLSRHYYDLSEEARKDYYYKIRVSYNEQRCHVNYSSFSKEWIPRAARMIFLNKTCYNGLFRMNRQGQFNVPFGRYKHPKIADADNIRNVSKILDIADIRVGDFMDCQDLVNKNTFVYFDPPYRPISKTSSFTSYSKDVFDDNEQRRLAAFYQTLAQETGAKLMLSNSDPKNYAPDDHFFEELYPDHNIKRVYARRIINSDAKKRGHITELLITNYSIP